MLWLALGPFHAMENQVLVIRIKIPNSGAVDWTVHSGPQLLFRDVLDVIGQVLPEATTTAFEYEDEDGDRITVRSDEEMKAMLSYYYSTIMEQQVNGQLIEPLQIFPRACKPPGERNIHGLKVNTRAGPSQHSSPAVSDSLPSNSLKKSSAELKKILANGQMNEQDIRYRDTLGHGNGGTVYKAYHVPSGKILAVKVILLDITLELQKQIMSELEILYKCDSSYIIGFYGAFFVENRISICTEFMDGGSLDVYRKIPEHVLGRIAVAVVKGLTYLWSLKILHRDVKPSNMLVNTRGQVKLCDFGVSTQLVNSIAKTYVGTNAYMAPERISGEQYGIHSDVWSLGISFMELALGRFPYPQRALLPWKQTEGTLEKVESSPTPESEIQKNQGSLMPLQLLQCIVDEDSPVLPVGEFSEPFVHFITQCMRKQPKERPAPEELMSAEAEAGLWICSVKNMRQEATWATHSSCSSMTEIPPWCPCGCAGRWRRGGASRGPPETAAGC
ncbi:dual specificity mitogen-activated protein kinase kinase 5 isoform X5 [Sus scrofa]|uniref:dual specificity mitogen-activated protein kinase kinase 5 isoform X5 n=1 Tax=Sus scrofa TaxID=9823 RepID=UPI000A2B275F|nr:dual specificity mitogen-activated protein kinase kinase 5 isoform X5 [Sus scrofa]